MNSAKENSKEAKAKLTEAALAARVAADKKKVNDVKPTLAEKLGRTDPKN